MPDVLELLNRYRDCNIAVYGLGIETKKLLKQLSGDLHIIGLLDSYKEEGMIYDCRIIPFSEAIERQVKLILVVARPGSCKAIAGRIKGKCIEHGIDLIDIRGNDLCREKRVVYDFASVSGGTKAQLIEEVGKREVVSVDLFDTLIMRKTLFITDLFELLDAKLRKRGIEISNFASKRLSCEKELTNGRAPRLQEIYLKLSIENNVTQMSPDELAELEWETDCSLLVPRKAFCDFMDKLNEDGVKIYIVSDTYYTKQQIEKILEKCGIGFYADILASCEYGVGKQNGLFDRLMKRIGGKSCIHIGDDEVVDIACAKEHGLCAFRIYSAIDLFEAVGYFGMWDDMKSLSDRLKAGLFLANLFNNPFQFEKQDKRISINNAYDIGYLLLAPLITDFTFWFRMQIQEYNLKNIWFCARDGYLIKKLYDELTQETASIYFLTSRMAAIRAGIRDEKDIRYVEEMNFSGSVQEQLKERFGIQINKTEVDNPQGMGLTEYAKEIMERVKENEKNYLKYIETLQVEDGPVAFFDFVAKGTTQMFIGNLVSNHLKGLYFLQLEKENMKDKGLDIVSFYDVEHLYHSAIYEDYYILETVLTSQMPSLTSFDAGGKAIYADEKRTADDLRCIREMQTGIYEYFKEYIRLHVDKLPEINRKTDEKFLALIHHLNIHEERFTKMKVEDIFVNRFTDLRKLI